MGLQNGSPLCHIFSDLNLVTWTGSILSSRAVPCKRELYYQF